jgi:hypothetical protein
MPKQFYHSNNWGGQRPGAGRPRITHAPAALPRVDVLDQPGFAKPLDHLWVRANDPTLNAKYRDALMVKLLPYFHPRLGLCVTTCTRILRSNPTRASVSCFIAPNPHATIHPAAHYITITRRWLLQRFPNI